MIASLLIPVLVAGFFACHIHPVHAYRLHRYEGQYLYLKSAELGFKCLGLGCLVLVSLYGALWGLVALVRICWPNAWLTPDEVWIAFVAVMHGLGADTPARAGELAWVITLSVMTWVAAFVMKWWAAHRLQRRFGVSGRGSLKDIRVHVIGEILQDSPLDRLLFKLSLEKDKFAMLVMNDRKVYVGKVIDLGEPSATSGMDQDILIIPLMSGYRDKDDLRVRFTTHYSEVDASIQLALRQDSIVSATEFDFKAYRRWNPAPVVVDRALPEVSSDNERADQVNGNGA